ncbi:MAG: dihydrolipoyl dehydrogenase [Gammaproteobacteria bacterium]|nr:dihydrolipoyl dehydrogenase [Gammaproteobacteria bacterium]
MNTEVLVLGGGPGGYTAAFRAADLGKKVVLVERHPTLGGVCLNMGCIPSKALLHAAEIINQAREMGAHGIEFGKPRIDLAALRNWKDQVVGKLTSGLAQLAKQRKITIIQGEGCFSSANRLIVESAAESTEISFEYAIIAVGSRISTIPGFPYTDPRIMDSSGALNLVDIPQRLLVVGGGIIGLEMAAVYDALGSQITVVELTKSLLPGCDPDLARYLQRRIAKRYQAIHLNAKVTDIKAHETGLMASFTGPKSPEPAQFDRILVATGRQPNGGSIGAENAGILVDNRGNIPVDAIQRTNIPHIFAIGDVVGQPMLAHKAVHEGKVAAEVIGCGSTTITSTPIPSIAYTDPEVAWVGITETAAKEQGIAIKKASFPWAASGRALGMGRGEGTTKLLLDRNNGLLLGAGIVGAHAGELIAETALALKMGATAKDIAMTIHPHPTLSETIAFAAEVAEGTITDLYLPRKKR